MYFLNKENLNKEIIKIFIIFIFAFVSFFIFGLGDLELRGDSQGYVGFANQVLKEGKFAKVSGELTNYREPGYSFFLASVFLVFGEENFAAVRITQFILFLILVLVFYSTLDKCFKNKKAVFWSSFLLAVFPGFGFYNGQILSESVFIFLFGLIILLLIQIYYKNFLVKNYKYIILGLLLGILTLIKAIGIIIIFAIALFFLIKKQIKKVVIVCLFAVLIITPWVFRNAYHFDSPSITSGRQEHHLFAVSKIVLELSPSDIGRRAFLRLKKGFQTVSDEEVKFLDKYNENKIIRGNNDLHNFLDKNPDYNNKDLKDYSFGVIKKYPINTMVNTFLNMTSTLGPEIPTVIKYNNFFENSLFRKGFFLIYLLLYLFVYIINFIFLIKVLFPFKKKFVLLYLFYFITILILASYSFIVFCTRFNTPLFVLYILIIGFYFDYKYREKSTV